MINWLLDPYRDLHTYRVAAYLLLGLPLGIIEFVAIVTGLSMGLGLLVTLIGIPVLVATLLGVRAGASFERELARSLLAAPLPRSVHRPDSIGGLLLVAACASLATDRANVERAWRSCCCAFRSGSSTSPSWSRSSAWRSAASPRRSCWRSDWSPPGSATSSSTPSPSRSSTCRSASSSC